MTRDVAQELGARSSTVTLFRSRQNLRVSDLRPVAVDDVSRFTLALGRGLWRQITLSKEPSISF